LKFYFDIQEEFGVSPATVNNWVKTGVIPICPVTGYELDDYNRIVDKVKNQDFKLQQGTNRRENHKRTYSSVISGSIKTKLIIERLRELCSSQVYSYNDVIFVVSVILLQKNNLIKIYNSSDKLRLSSGNLVFTKFLNDWMRLCNTDSYELYKTLIVFDFSNDENDFIGVVYESLRTISEKSITGAFFTPRDLSKDLVIPIDSKVLDPCAGTGTLLLNSISKNHDYKKIFLRDVDILALRIALVNFIIFFNSVNKIINIRISDITESSSVSSRKFDIIISNPPFGARFSEIKKKQIISEFPELNTTESFSIALYQSLKMLNAHGKLYFILPESILYVGSHTQIRKEIFTKMNSVSIRPFGNAFKGVMSSIIRLELQKKRGERIIVFDKGNIDFSDMDISKNLYRPPCVFDNSEIELLKKTYSCKSFNLKNRCRTGLGIVTGNNKRHIFDSSKKLSKDAKIIYTGKELKAFKFDKPKYFIDFKPNLLQQTASLKQYSSSKICYRFISNRPITLFDESGSLVLNSINFFELTDKRINPKALSAFLNSDIVAWIYRIMFNSTKVLKSHIESIPIPIEFFNHMDDLEKIYLMASVGKDVVKELNSICNLLYGVENSHYIV
jgi:hypothetical protein